jgi:hypothetical protein
VEDTVFPLVISERTPCYSHLWMVAMRAEGVVGTGREGEVIPDGATRGVEGVEGVAGQEAVIAWQRTVLFPQGEV